MASKNDERETLSYSPELEGYKGQTLPTNGVPVRVREVLIESMNHYQFNDEDSYKVSQFITHIETNGFTGLQGRNKKSNNPDTNDSDFAKKAQFAVKNHLFHYHIGVPTYELSVHGDLTSSYVVHYSFNAELGYVAIICVDYHPPMQLPYEEDLESPFMIENPLKSKE